MAPPPPPHHHYPIAEDRLVHDALLLLKALRVK